MGWILSIGLLLAALGWAYLPTWYRGRHFRREFNQLMAAWKKASDEGRWSDWVDIGAQIDEHFVRRDAWIDKMTMSSRLYRLTWNDVKEDK